MALHHVSVKLTSVVFGRDHVSVAMSVGSRIKKRRQQLDMTQQQLADALGVAKSTVANWESGTHFPLRKLGAVETVLGVTLDGEETEPPRRREVPPHTKRVLKAALPDGDDYERVIALLERPEDDGGRDARAG